MSFMASLRKEIMELWRTSRFLILGIVLVFFGLTSPLIAQFTPELMKIIPGGEQFASLIPKPTALDALAQYVKNLNQFGVLMALLLTMGAVASEKERGTAAMVLVKPLPRGTFLLAKFIAIGLAFLAALIVAGLGAYYYTYVVFEPLDIGSWIAMNGLLWLYFMVFVALTLLFSTIVRSQAAAAGMGFGAIILFSIVGITPVVAKFLPGQLIVWGGSLFTAKPLTLVDVPALWVCLVLIAGSLIAAWQIFERQEI